MVIIHVAGFQTVAIFMQTGELEKSAAAIDAIGDIVKDSPHKVCTIILLTDFCVYFNFQLARYFWSSGMNKKLGFLFLFLITFFFLI